jgi:hypothetical protein
LGGPHSRSGNSEGENIFAYIPQSSHYTSQMYFGHSPQFVMVCAHGVTT